MKQIYVLLITCFLFFNVNAQTQIGGDIDGESTIDQSGYAVSLSANGSILAVGAPVNSDNGSAAGHVRIFQNQNDSWIQLGTDIDGLGANDFFGLSVSLSATGNRVAIGAPESNTGNTGYVTVLDFENNTWVQVGNIIQGENPGDFFGWSVSLSSDGNTLVVGAPGNSDNGSFAGHVRIYEFQNDSWVQIVGDIDSEAMGDEFGRSTALSDNGEFLAVGAVTNDGNGIDSGHVRIYEFQNGSWVQIGQDIDGENAGDWFGRSVSLSTQGDRIAVGGIFNSDNGLNSGHVRIFELQNNSWVQIGADIDGISENEQTGVSVDLSSDGNVVVISAPGNSTNGNLSGQVRIFEYVNNNWEQIGIPINGEGANDEFGFALSLSSNSQYLAIGAPVNSGNGFASGHVRVYNISALLSVKEINTSNFKLYPNPTRDQFTIQVDNPSEIIEVKIFNDLGQLVLTSKETTVNTSRLVPGLYMIEVETSGGKVLKKLIVE
ncbi:T9SS type A sorting domain-containing protein [Winogradskyella sp.]|uniref:T9SS type A sorting domain-containing protein n=1 Tax=Winogradskyella sp. TaxID=1883156 RepID=UPI0026135512|nr:T9SS type A sorting domain-containing protein [Winogradskyella sp.]